MSKYTTEVRYICEVNADLDESKGFNNVDEIITEAAPKIFDFEFPIYDEAYRLPFEKMILRHFYMREIGLETVGLWKLKLWDKLNLIMPYYNKMYQSALLDFNPLYDVDLTTNHSGQGSGSSNDNETVNEDRNRKGNLNEDETVRENKQAVGTNSGSESITEDKQRNTTDNNTQWNLFSDTPQGSLRNINMGDLDDTTFNTYLTDARKITNDGAGSATERNLVGKEQAGNDTTTEDNTIGRQRVGTDTVNETNVIGRQKVGTVTSMDSYTDRVFGKRGNASYSSMIMEFRKTFLRIDEMVCKELEELFLGLW